MIRKLQSPVLITGFHHSGTRLLSEMLRLKGLFQVVNQKTHEWNYIQNINNRIFEKWYLPDKISIEGIEKNASKIPKNKLLINLIRYRYKGGYWAIKDPRLCLTLPAWKIKFPNAKIINIIRDPLDVIGTLPITYSKFSPEKKTPQLELEFWTNLWITTTEFLETYIKKSCPEYYYSLTYEDLCSNPNSVISEAFNKLEIHPRNSPIEIDLEIKPGYNKYKSWLSEGKITYNQIQFIKNKTENFRRRYSYI